MTAGAGCRGCKGTLFNYCWPNTFLQGFQQQSFSPKAVLSVPLLQLVDVTLQHGADPGHAQIDSLTPGNHAEAQHRVNFPFLQGLPSLLPKTAPLLHTNDSELKTSPRPTIFFPRVLQCPFVQFYQSTHELIL